MHFIDRTLFTIAPHAELLIFQKSEQPKWIAYKNYLISKTPPIVREPASKWNGIAIKTPLATMFHFNCCYCGNYSDTNNDGEVDHFLPKALDVAAMQIYSWDNYVWACHPCNNKKRNHYPLLNPCNLIEIEEIYFHSADGRYECYGKANNDIQTKYKLTDSQTFMNGKVAPQRRRNISRQLDDIYLSDIRLWEEIYEVERQKDALSSETNNSKLRLDKAIKDLMDFFESNDFVLLKKYLIENYKLKHPSFQYSYEDFI